MPRLDLEVSSINQDPIVIVEESAFFKIKGALFMVDSFEDVVDVVVHGKYSIKLFFCSVRGEFIVVIEVYSAWIKYIETSVEGEFVDSGVCGIIAKLGNW